MCPERGAESHTAPSPQTSNSAAAAASRLPSATSDRCIAAPQRPASPLHATPVDSCPGCSSASSHIAAALRTNSARHDRSYVPRPLRLYISTHASVSRHAAVLTAFSVRKSTGRTTTDRSSAQREGSARWRLA